MWDFAAVLREALVNHLTQSYKKNETFGGSFPRNLELYRGFSANSYQFSDLELQAAVITPRIYPKLWGFLFYDSMTLAVTFSSFAALALS